MYDVCIIGGGVLGCAVARELSRYSLSVAVLESADDVCCAEPAAGGIVCAARTLAPFRPAAAKYAATGEKMFRAYAAALGVPYMQTGCMTAFLDDADGARMLAVNARRCGVGCTELTGEEAVAVEPALASAHILRAAYFPNAGVVDACAFVYALRRNAERNGAEFIFGFTLSSAELTADGASLRSSSGEVVEARRVVNCAGNGGGQVARALGDFIYISHRSGNYAYADVPSRPSMPVFFERAGYVSPDPRGGYFVGADTADCSRVAPEVTGAPDARRALRDRAGLSAENAAGYADVRALMRGGDLYEARGKSPCVLHLLGAGAFGITVAPALATAYARSLRAEKRADFLPVERGIVRAAALSAAERNALASRKPLYANVVMTDPYVTEGEIAEAIARGARSLQGAARRLLPGRAEPDARFAEAFGRLTEPEGI